MKITTKKKTHAKKNKKKNKKVFSIRYGGKDTSTVSGLLGIGVAIIGAVLQGYILLMGQILRIGWRFSLLGIFAAAVVSTICLYFFYKAEMEHEKIEKKVLKTLLKSKV